MFGETVALRWSASANCLIGFNVYPQYLFIVRSTVNWVLRTFTHKTSMINNRQWNLHLLYYIIICVCIVLFMAILTLGLLHHSKEDYKTGQYCFKNSIVKSWIPLSRPTTWRMSRAAASRWGRSRGGCGGARRVAVAQVWGGAGGGRGIWHSENRNNVAAAKSTSVAG